MQQQQTALDIEKLREFELRMHYEGEAAFAAGPAPWDSWEDMGTLGTWQRLEDHPQHPVRRPRRQRNLGQRILGGITRLLVLALLAGIGGIYLEARAPVPVAVNGIRPAPIVSTRKIADTRPANDKLALDELPAPAAGNRSWSGIEVVARPADSTGSVLPELTAAATGTGQAMTATPDPENPGGFSDSDPVAPAAGTEPAAEAVIPAATTPNFLAARNDTASTVTSPAESTEAVIVSDTPDAPAAQAVIAQPAMETATVQDTATETANQVAMLDAPATTDGSAGGAAVDAATTTAPAPKGGDWVVNLAAYNSESVAQRMLEEFRNKGVDAELVTITVHDKPMLRIRTSGYQSASEAREWVALLEERLDLEGVWISKRQ